VEFIVPDPVVSSNNHPPVLRLVAVDELGQEGFGELMFTHRSVGSGPFSVLTDLSAGVVVGQQFLFKCTGQTGGAFILLDDLRTHVDLGVSGFGLGVNVLFNDIPAASTDLARYGIVVGEDWYYSDYFSIRPHPLAGDAAPVVSMLKPQAGDVFAAGSIVPTSWMASDDEDLRSFDVQASYDGGFTGHFVVRDLPGTSTQYGWNFPPSQGISDVRVRVIARDERFQSSSDGTHRVIELVPGESIGTNYCSPVVANSTGVPASISAAGSDRAGGQPSATDRF
jgi:hypothetical protein